MSLSVRIKDGFLKRKRTALARKCSDGPLKEFLTANSPNINSKIFDTEFLIADLEMTGLNHKQDKILSVGTTLIKEKQIIHSQAKHQLVYRPNADLSNSAPIHRIFDSDLLEGQNIVEVLSSFLKQLEGRVLVLHHAALDMSFLNAVCKRHFGAGIACLTVDTLAIELAKFQLQGKEPRNLDLANTRQRYGLPAYTAHNAAIDALATAELLLAQLSFIDPDNREALKVLL